MPRLHCVGFLLPLTIALVYLPIGVAAMRLKAVVYFAVAGLATYYLPISHPHGVGIFPFYLTYVFVYLARGVLRGDKTMEAIPALSTLLTFSFLSLAVPDFFLTWQRGGSAWAVGGDGWQDGLLRFWLYLIPVAGALFVMVEFARAKDQKLPVAVAQWLWHHFSPWPSFRPQPKSIEHPRDA